QTYRDLEEAERSVFKYIELFYNPIRLHQTGRDSKWTLTFEVTLKPLGLANSKTSFSMRF
ncbi:MAG: hypothetical protein ACKOAU_07510, partial [Pirellula sp.]